MVLKSLFTRLAAIALSAACLAAAAAEPFPNKEIRLDPRDPLGRDMCGLRLLPTSIEGHLREVNRRHGESAGREPQRVTSLPRA